MSHHYPGPEFAFPNKDARLNFTDMFAFPKPGDDSKSIIILDFHPSEGLNPKGPTTTIPFAANALYELMIDSDGDNVANIAYSVRFAESPDGKQTATLRRIDGSSSERSGQDGTIVLQGAPVSLGGEAAITNAGDYRFFAGLRSLAGAVPFRGRADRVHNRRAGERRAVHSGLCAPVTTCGWIQSRGCNADRGHAAARRHGISARAPRIVSKQRQIADRRRCRALSFDLYRR
jgi:Domain of unknown function (DUF4331)